MGCLKQQRFPKILGIFTDQNWRQRIPHENQCRLFSSSFSAQRIRSEKADEKVCLVTYFLSELYGLSAINNTKVESSRELGKILLDYLRKDVQSPSKQILLKQIF